MGDSSFPSCFIDGNNTLRPFVARAVGRSGLPGDKRRISSLFLPLSPGGKQGAQQLFWVRCFRLVDAILPPPSFLPHLLTSFPDHFLLLFKGTFYLALAKLSFVK